MLTKDEIHEIIDFHESPIQTLLSKLIDLPRAQVWPVKGSNPCIFIPGTRKKNRVLLVAHTDTIPGDGVDVSITGDVLYSNNPKKGIGADDRAGCWILYALRNMGHSLLFCSDEEKGCLGSAAICDNPALKNHAFIMEFDRRGPADIVNYGYASEGFIDYLRDYYVGFSEASGSYTDICELCPGAGLQGVNMSVGYYNEHTADELLHLGELSHTLGCTRNLLSESSLPRYPIHEDMLDIRVGRPSIGYASYFRGQTSIWDDDDLDPLMTSITIDELQDLAEKLDVDLDDLPRFGDYYCPTCVDLLDRANTILIDNDAPLGDFRVCDTCYSEVHSIEQYI